MKIATKKLTVKVAVTAPVKAAIKAAIKAPVKTASKTASKSVPPAAKTISKPVVKPTTKPATKSISKPVATKVVPKTAAKSTKTETSNVPKVQAKPVVKSASVKINDQATPAKSSKKVTPVVAQAKTKADSKPKVALSNSISPMPITSKTVASEASNTVQASPAATKARTSRLAQLTVPSMAQSVASTAAKSSYGPAFAAQVLVPPPQFVAKQNPKLANNWKTKTAEELTDEEVLAMPNSEYMNIKQMMFFRSKLIFLKKGILESAGATTEHLRDESAVVPDPTDRATIEEEHALELRTRDRERKLLKKIEQSISRIDAGDYGYCDETGEAIGVGRLLARPTATLSLEAQQRRELKQKMFGD